MRPSPPGSRFLPASQTDSAGLLRAVGQLHHPVPLERLVFQGAIAPRRAAMTGGIHFVLEQQRVAIGLERSQLGGVLGKLLKGRVNKKVCTRLS